MHVHHLTRLLVLSVRAAAKGCSEFERCRAAGGGGEVRGRFKGVVHVGEGVGTVGVRKGNDVGVAVLRGVMGEGGAVAVARSQRERARTGDEANRVEMAMDGSQVAGRDAKGTLAHNEVGIPLRDVAQDRHVPFLRGAVRDSVVDIIDFTQ